MLRAPEKWLMATNLKSLEKGKMNSIEHLLCIYYAQALGWAMDSEQVHCASQWLDKADAIFLTVGLRS